MRTYLIVTVSRRGGECFPIKTPRQEVIGLMRLNAAKGRHEMELTEEQFLKFDKDRAALCAVPGMATYVAEIRGTDAPSIADVALSDFGKIEAKTVKETFSDMIDDLKGVPFFALRKMAHELGVSTKEIKGTAEMRAAIRQAREMNVLSHAA